MSLLLTVTAATQLCAGCTVEFEPTDTLGSTADPAGGGLMAELLKMGDRGYLMSSDLLGPVVIVYDSDGRYQRELTREGDGPGEFRGFPEFAMGPGGILMREQFAASLHLYSSDLEFTRTFRVPGVAGSIQPDPLTGGWLVTYMGAGDGTEAGVLLLDQDAEVVRTMPVGEEASSLNFMVGDAIRGRDGRIWIASVLGVVEVFDEDLALLGSLELDCPGSTRGIPTGPSYRRPWSSACAPRPTDRACGSSPSHRSSTPTRFGACRAPGHRWRSCSTPSSTRFGWTRAA